MRSIRREEHDRGENGTGEGREEHEGGGGVIEKEK